MSMRIVVIAAAGLALGLAGAARAAPASIEVAIGSELQAKAGVYGQRDLERLAERLRAEVQRETARAGVYDGARIVLELTDAVPNRPTFKQLSDNTSLSYDSFGIGGARIEGHIVSPNGQVVPLSYRYYDPDIRYAELRDTWFEADWTIDRLARQLGRGKAVYQR